MCSTYTSGLNTFGAPANAKNVLAVGAAMSSNSGYIAHKSANYQTWEVVISGPHAKHWVHSNIRGLSPFAAVSNPDTHQISAKPVAGAVQKL